MRKNGKNKKLALLVGMAMAFSAAYSVAPSDALAATYTVGATTSDGSTTWTVKADGEIVESATADTVKNALKTAGNSFTLDSRALEALKGADDSNTEIAEGNTITVETKSGDTVTSSVSYTAAASTEDSTVGIDKEGKLAGSYSTITISGATGENDTATKASLADKATVGKYEVTGGKVELSGTADTVNVAKDAILSSDSKDGLKAAEINLAEGATLAENSSFTTEKVTVAGDKVDLSKATIKADTDETLTITNNSGSVTLGAVTGGTTVTANGVEATTLAEGATINGGAGEVKLTGAVSGGTITAGTVTLDSTVSGGSITAANGVTVTGAVSGKTNIDGGAGDVTLTGGLGTNDSEGAAPTIKGNNITFGAALTGDSHATIEAAGDVKFTGDNNATKNVSITAGGTVDVGSTAMTNENMANINANKLKTTGAVTVSKELTGIKNIETEGAFTVSGSDALNFDSVTAGSFSNTITTSGDNAAPAVNIKSLTVNGAYTNSGTVNVDSLKLGEKATISSNAKVNTKTLILDSSTSNLKDQIGNLTINGGDGSSDVKIVVADKGGAAPSDDLLKALSKAIYGDENSTDKVLANTTTVDSSVSVDDATTAVNSAKDKMQTYSTYTAEEIQTKIANADPFSTKLPSLADLQAMTSADEQKNLEALNTAQKALYESQVAAGTITPDELAEKIAALPQTTAEQAEKIRAAVQNAGKTAAAPAVTSMRTANVVADVATTNVVNRTAELRSFVPSAESEEKPDNLWFQYKHSKIDVDNGDTYSKSTVKTNSYQLGYDAKVSDTDIVGGYVGTTTGSSEFNGPARSGSVDIKNALDLGLYGTHMMTKGQYIDYMLHRNKFDNRTMGQTYGTTDLGAMLRYGVKIAQPNGLTLDPYIQLAYDKISVDSYQAGENTISSDDSNNFSTKIGLNLITTGGLYGGVAYSRGLSGSYSAYVNGIAMPTQDNDTNVIYLNLGYRAGIARDIFLDLSLEKTFCDYDGWNAAGKINFYF